MWTNLRVLALVCFILPIVTVIVSYVASIKIGLVTACIPNFEGCTSISRVGRYYPVNYFFKTMMYVYAIVLFLFWKNLIDNLKILKITEKKLFWIAIVSVLFLILYITFLGEGKIYSFFRKIGIYIYILFTVITQFLIIKKFYKIKQKIKKIYNTKFIKINYFLSLFLIISGFLLLPILILKIEDFPQIKHIISWNYFLLIQLYFLFAFFIFKKPNFR